MAATAVMITASHVAQWRSPGGNRGEWHEQYNSLLDELISHWKEAFTVGHRLGTISGRRRGDDDLPPPYRGWRPPIGTRCACGWADIGGQTPHENARQHVETETYYAAIDNGIPDWLAGKIAAHI